MRRGSMTIVAALMLAILLTACGGSADERVTASPDAGATAPVSPSPDGSTSPTPDASPAETTAAGSGLYVENCSECHRKDGSGDVGPSIRDHHQGVDHLMEHISEGGARMPAFEGRLTRKEIRAIAEYVHETLQ